MYSFTKKEKMSKAHCCFFNQDTKSVIFLHSWVEESALVVKLERWTSFKQLFWEISRTSLFLYIDMYIRCLFVHTTYFLFFNFMNDGCSLNDTSHCVAKSSKVSKMVQNNEASAKWLKSKHHHDSCGYRKTSCPIEVYEKNSFPSWPLWTLSCRVYGLSHTVWEALM